MIFEMEIFLENLKSLIAAKFIIVQKKINA